MRAKTDPNITTVPARTADPIPLAKPDLSGREAEYVAHAIESSWISSTGEYVDRFESEFAALCGTRSAVSICNGTAALHLALLALDVQPGDEVLVPSLTYIATANAVRYVGAEPVFVDCDPKTWCIDPTLLEASITRRTKGIIPVHLYGHPADMDEINRVARAHGLWVVEDAAEAHFARYKDRVVGGLGQMATFSFYGNKMFTSGEGGAITIDDPEVEARLRMLRGQGMDPHRRYYFPVTGYNFRLTNLACALLCAQLERRKEMTERRHEIVSAYRKALADVEGVDFQPHAPWAEPAPWLFSVTIDPIVYGRTRDELATLLRQQGIETRPFFIPLDRLPPFQESARRQGIQRPVADQLSDRGINLPTFTAMTDATVERVATAIRGGRG